MFFLQVHFDAFGMYPDKYSFSFTDLKTENMIMRVEVTSHGRPILDQFTPAHSVNALKEPFITLRLSCLPV